MEPFHYHSRVLTAELKQYLGNLGALNHPYRSNPGKEDPLLLSYLDIVVNQARALGWHSVLPSSVDARKWETLPHGLRKLNRKDALILIQNLSKILQPIAPSSKVVTQSGKEIEVPMIPSFNKRDSKLFWGVPYLTKSVGKDRTYSVFNKKGKRVKIQVEREGRRVIPKCSPRYQNLSVTSISQKFTVWPVPFIPADWGVDIEKAAIVGLFGQSALFISEPAPVEVVAEEVKPSLKEIVHSVPIKSEIQDQYTTPTGHIVEELPLGNDTDPFEWQKLAIGRWIDNSYRGLVEAVTGAGKTQLCVDAIVSVLEEYPRTHISIVVPTKALLSQWAKEVKHQLSDRVESITLHSGDHVEKEPGQLALYVINTASKKLPMIHQLEGFRQRYPFHFLCVDEVHRSTSRTFKEIYSCEPDFALGVTATIPKNLKRYEILEQNIGKLLCVYKYAHALMKGNISQFDLTFLETSLISRELDIYEELTERIRKIAKTLPSSMTPEEWEAKIEEENLAAEAGEALDSKELVAVRMMKMLGGARARISWSAARRLSCAMSVINETLEQNKKIIVFHKSINGAAALYNLLQQAGHEIGIYHSDQPKYINEAYLEAFKEGRIKCMLSVQALLEGLNVPDADVGLAVAADQSEIKAVQSLGRVLRINPGTDLKKYYLLVVKGTKDEEVLVPRFKETLALKNGELIVPTHTQDCPPISEEEITNLQQLAGLPDPELVAKWVEEDISHITQQVWPEGRPILEKGVEKAKKEALSVKIEHPAWATTRARAHSRWWTPQGPQRPHSTGDSE